MKYTYDYPMPAFTVDMVLFDETVTKVLLIQRRDNPYKDCWAFPGGFVNINELSFDAAKRELQEETGIIKPCLYQYKLIETVGRDPRGRILSMVYYGYITDNDNPIAGDDAKAIQWFDINDLPKLAFDHESILRQILTHFAMEEKWNKIHDKLLELEVYHSRTAIIG